MKTAVPASQTPARAWWTGVAMGLFIVHSAMPASYVTNADERCVDDVVAAFDSLDHHGEPMGFNIDQDLINPSHSSHWQGITRHPYAANFLYVSKNEGRWYECFTTKSGLAIVKLGTSESNLPRRSNLHRRGGGFISSGSYPASAPPASHRIERFLINTTLYKHPGGLQATGDLLVVPYEDGPSGVNAVAAIFDIRDPREPRRRTVETPDSQPHNGLIVPSRRMGAAGIVRDGQLPSGLDRYVVIATIGTPENRRLSLWSIAHDPTNPHLLMLRQRLSIPQNSFFQNMQLVKQCDGSLFAIGLGNGNDGDNRIQLYQLNIVRDPDNATISALRGIEAIRKRQLSCKNAATLGFPYCELLAGGGIYIDPQGTLGLYGVEYDNKGAVDSTRFTEFWNREGNPSRTCEADGAWLTLYQDTNFRGETLTMTHFNETKDDFDRFSRLPWNDEASSLRTCLPAGCSLDLCKHAFFKDCIILSGPSEPLTTRLVTDPNLHEAGMGDRVSSARFRGTCGPIGGWAAGEPNDLGGEDCVEIHPNGLLNDASCRKSRSWACRSVTEPATWIASRENSSWRADLPCPSGFTFTYPKQAEEQQALATQIGQTVWVNISDIEQEGRFVGSEHAARLTSMIPH